MKSFNSIIKSNGDLEKRIAKIKNKSLTILMLNHFK